MLTKIFLSYEFRNPIGYLIWDQFDEIPVDSHPTYNDRTKERVTKAINFLFKLDRDGLRPCHMIRFDFQDDPNELYPVVGYSLCCEVKGVNGGRAEENRSLVTVQKRYYSGSSDEPYLIERAALRRMVLAELPKEDNA